MEEDDEDDADQQGIWPPRPYADDEIVLAGESADIPIRTGMGVTISDQNYMHPMLRMLSNLADLMVPRYHPDQDYMQQMHSDLVSSIELLTHADGERELPFIPLKQVVAHQLMLDLAAGVIWRNLELIVPPPLHFAGDAALDQPPELVDHSDDEMPELEPDSDDDKLVNGGWAPLAADPR